MRQKYQSEFHGEDIDLVVKKALLKEDLSVDEYQALVSQDKVKADTVYRVYSDQSKSILSAVYFGRVCIVPQEKLVMAVPYGSDASVPDIDAAHKAGRVVLCLVDDIFPVYPLSGSVPLSGIRYHNGEPVSAQFSKCFLFDGDVREVVLTLSSAGDWDCEVSIESVATVEEIDSLFTGGGGGISSGGSSEPSENE